MNLKYEIKNGLSLSNWLFLLYMRKDQTILRDDRQFNIKHYPNSKCNTEI